jgi:hypothetical protein
MFGFTSKLKFIFNFVIIVGDVSTIVYNFCMKYMSFVNGSVIDICKMKLPFTFFFL